MNHKINLKNLRQEYGSQGLSRLNAPGDPFELFSLWFDECRKQNLLEPNAFSLATVSPEGIPRQRMILLKSFDTFGFVFFTNYTSIKANHISANSKVSLLFNWLPLQHQVLITGECEKVSRSINEEYFNSRPRGSQIGAWASNQSSVIASRKDLDDVYSRFEIDYADKEVPLPNFWGGYLVKPFHFEFWSGRQNRMHDRLQYSFHDNSWEVSRLCP